MREKSVVIEEVTVRKFVVGRELSPKECDQPLAVLNPKEKGDLILKSSTVAYGRISNVPRRFAYSQWINWGYSGAGPYDLALNVLYHFSDQNEAFTRKFVHLFVGEVIQKLPMDTALRIDGEFLITWVREKLDLLESGGSDAMPVFSSGQLSPAHLVWDDNDRTILAPLQIS